MNPVNLLCHKSSFLMNLCFAHSGSVTIPRPALTTDATRTDAQTSKCLCYYVSYIYTKFHHGILYRTQRSWRSELLMYYHSDCCNYRSDQCGHHYTSYVQVIVSVVIYITVYQCVYKPKLRSFRAVSGTDHDQSEREDVTRGDDAIVYDVVDKRVRIALKMKGE